MKYTEVPLNENEVKENPFKKGDFINVYMHGWPVSQRTVYSIEKECVHVKKSDCSNNMIDYHWRQCRLVKPVEPREFIYCEKCSETWLDDTYPRLKKWDKVHCQDKGHKTLTLREVLSDD